MAFEWVTKVYLPISVAFTLLKLVITWNINKTKANTNAIVIRHRWIWLVNLIFSGYGNWLQQESILWTWFDYTPSKTSIWLSSHSLLLEINFKKLEFMQISVGHQCPWWLLEVRQKYSFARRIFNSLLSVSRLLSIRHPAGITPFCCRVFYSAHSTLCGG